MEVVYMPVRDAKGISRCENLVICQTGYCGLKRQHVKRMVRKIGANYSKALVANKVTHLICCKFKGLKYRLSRQLGLKIVNYQWLEDCLKEWVLLPEEMYLASGSEVDQHLEPEACAQSGQAIDTLNADTEDPIEDLRLFGGATECKVTCQMQLKGSAYEDNILKSIGATDTPNGNAKGTSCMKETPNKVQSLSEAMQPSPAYLFNRASRTSVSHSGKDVSSKEIAGNLLGRTVSCTSRKKTTLKKRRRNIVMEEQVEMLVTGSLNAHSNTIPACLYNSANRTSVTHVGEDIGSKKFARNPLSNNVVHRSGKKTASKRRRPNVTMEGQVEMLATEALNAHSKALKFDSAPNNDVIPDTDCGFCNETPTEREVSNQNTQHYDKSGKSTKAKYTSRRKEHELFKNHTTGKSGCLMMETTNESSERGTMKQMGCILEQAERSKTFKSPIESTAVSDSKLLARAKDCTDEVRETKKQQKKHLKVSFSETIRVIPKHRTHANFTSQSSKVPAPESVKLKCFALSGHDEEKKSLRAIARRLGGKLCPDSHLWSDQTTHLVVAGSLRRTEKLLSAAAAGRWVLRGDYLVDSNAAKGFLEEERYEWHGSGFTEDGLISLEAPRKWRKLRESTGTCAFTGMGIMVYGECSMPSLDTLKRAIRAGGGEVLAACPPYTDALDAGADFAIVNPGIPLQDRWIQEFLDEGVACVTAEFFVDFVCRPPLSLDRHVLYNTHSMVQSALVRLEVGRYLIARKGKANAAQNMTCPGSDDMEVCEGNNKSDTAASSNEDGDDIACLVCGKPDREDVMLLCGDDQGSGCGIGMHIDCCEPPLTKIPAEDWYCTNCRKDSKPLV